MKEYIDKEAAKNAIYSEISQHYKDVGDSLYERGYHNGLTMAYSILLDVPAADVVEKRYGEWGKPMHTEHGWIRKCSSCLYSSCVGTKDFLPDCCSNCGADMRGKKE